MERIEIDAVNRKAAYRSGDHQMYEVVTTKVPKRKLVVGVVVLLGFRLHVNEGTSCTIRSGEKSWSIQERQF